MLMADLVTQQQVLILDAFDLANDVNRLFDVEIFFIISSCFLGGVIMKYSLAKSFGRQLSLIGFSLTVSELLANDIVIFYLCYSCEAVMGQIECLRKRLMTMTVYFEDSRIRKQAIQFIEQLDTVPIDITAMWIFRINKELIYKMGGAIFTIIVTLLQFETLMKPDDFGIL